MSELTPDPVLDRLARFRPAAASFDPAEILFRAGRASVRTHWGWKLAVAGLVLALIPLVLFVALREAPSAPASPEVVPAIGVLPVAIPTPEPSPSPSPSESASPWSLGALLRTIDPNDLPQSPSSVGLSPADPPLTPRSRGEFD